MLSGAFIIAPLPHSGTSEANAAGGTRTLWLHFTHTGEEKKITFRRNGKYVAQGLKDLNWILRDWRRNEATKMDPRLFDLIWSVYQDSGANVPIRVVSGFRSKRTNDALRRRSRGVAKTSQHTAGKAMDFFIPGVPVRKLREIGLKIQEGGVGYYPGSRTPFVHMDTGRVRHWPRMTPKQLARVFPNGKTLHTSTTGSKQRQYALALKEYNVRKTKVLQPLTLSKREIRVAEKSQDNSKSRSGNGLLGGLFKGGKDKKNAAPEVVVASAAKPAKKPVPKQAPIAKKASKPKVIANSVQSDEKLPIPSRIGRDTAEKKAPLPVKTPSVVAALVPAPRAVPKGLREQFAPAQSIVVAQAPTPLVRPARAEAPTPVPQIVVARAGVLAEPLADPQDNQPQVFDPTTTATLRRQDFKVPTPDVIKNRHKFRTDPMALLLAQATDSTEPGASLENETPLAYASALSTTDALTKLEDKKRSSFKIERKALPAPKVLKAEPATAAKRFASLAPQSSNPVFTLNDIGFDTPKQTNGLRTSLKPVADTSTAQDVASASVPSKSLSVAASRLEFSGEAKGVVDILLSQSSIVSSNVGTLSVPLPNNTPELFVSPSRAFAGTFSDSPQRTNTFAFAGETILVTPTVDFNRAKRTQFSWLNRR